MSREYNESCCWTIEKFSFFHNYFAIIDTADYLADQLFTNRRRAFQPLLYKALRRFLSKKDEVAVCLFHCFRPLIPRVGHGVGQDAFRTRTKGAPPTAVSRASALCPAHR